MLGWFGQGGIILNQHSLEEGQPLIEVAARYAHFRPNLNIPMNSEDEYSLAVNCFFNGHLNKLTADMTLFDFENRSVNREASGWRFRIQYDFSF
jgi:hypothetical protein